MNNRTDDHTYYEEQEKKIQRRPQDFEPEVRRKVITLSATQVRNRVWGETLSLLLLCGEDSLEGDEDLARGSALGHMKEGIVDLNEQTKEPKCDWTCTHAYFNEHLSLVQFLK